MPSWNKLSLPDANSTQMEQILFFHDHIFIILILVITLIFYFSFSISQNKFTNKFLFEAQQLETIWTCIPAILIILIAFPSLTVLYSMEESSSSVLSVKISGHQWYWSYKITNFQSMDVFSKASSSLNNPFRLLDTNERLIIPSLVATTLYISSTDVIHSWTIPSLGVKADAVPGRINQVQVLPLRPGVFYGQCSEICGANHTYSPIALEVTPLVAFISWMKF